MKTTIDLKEGIMQLARMQAIKENRSLSEVIEDALNQYLPSSIKAERQGDNLRFESGPTIAQMQLKPQTEETVTQKIFKQQIKKLKKQK